MAPAHPTPARPVVRALATAALLACVGAATASAASPSPSAGTDPGPQANLEVWLDQAITPDAAPGATIPIGLTLWDTDRGQLAELTGAYVRLHPAKGSARPTEATTQSDWPGHLVAEVVVPKGGPGAIEAGTRGRACTSDGACTDLDLPFPFGGVGPPPDAPRSILIVATVREPRPPLAAGLPIDVVVDVEPLGQWDPAALGLPDRLVAIANHPQGPDLATAELRADPPGQTRAIVYSGQITIPDPGEVALAVAIPGNGTEDQVIPTSLIRFTVAPGIGPAASVPPGSPAGPSPAGPSPADGVPWILLGGVALLPLAAGLVIRRVFADL